MKPIMFFSLLFLVFTACQDDDDALPIIACGTPIIIADQTDVPPSDNFSLTSIVVEGTCMTVTIGASGCTDEGWTMKLRTDGSIAESLPTQSHARLIFDDQVEGGSTCLAFFTNSYEFDLSEYLSAGALPSNLLLTGPDTEQTMVAFD